MKILYNLNVFSPKTANAVAQLTIQHQFGLYNFSMFSSSGDKILQSEVFTTAAQCAAAMRFLIEQCDYMKHYEKRVSANGQFYFVVKNAREKIIATSELYWSSSSRDYAMISVKREAPYALIN